MQEKVDQEPSLKVTSVKEALFSLLLHHFSVLIFIITYFSDDNKQFKEKQVNC